MPISDDPGKRARQLQNLRRGKAPSAAEVEAERRKRVEQQRREREERQRAEAMRPDPPVYEEEQHLGGDRPITSGLRAGGF